MYTLIILLPKSLSFSNSLRFGLVGLFSFWFSASVVLAANISSISVTPASSQLSANTSYTITFTAPSNVTAPGGYLSISSYSLSGPNDQGFLISFASATLDAATTVSGTLDAYNSNNPGGRGIQLSAGLTAGQSYTVKFNNVVNPSRAGAYRFMVQAYYQGNQIDGGETATFYLGFGPMTKTVSGRVTYPNGSGVTTASIGANQSQNGTYLSVNADASGNYSLTLPGGTWEIMLNAQYNQQGQQVATDWAYNQPPARLTFSQDASVETQTINYSVVLATARVSGKIVNPDGTAAQNGGVSVRDSKGNGNNGGFDQNGNFNISVPAGTYSLDIFVQNQALAAPAMKPFTINDGETKNLGTITLVTKNEHLKGTIRNKVTGTAVGGITVNAWKETGGWGQTTSAADGTYDLAVTAGTWQIQPQPDPSTGYTFEAGPPTQKTLSTNQTMTGVDFVVISADATINGEVVDGNGNRISNIFAFAMAMEGTGDPPKPGPGGQVTGGTFTLRVPNGTWTVNVMLPPDVNYTSAGGQRVTVAKNGTVNVRITLKQNDAVINGTVKDQSGNTITGQSFQIFAHDGAGNFKNGQVNPSNGQYSLGVVGGSKWFVGMDIMESSDYMMTPPDDSSVSVASGQTVTKDITVYKANSVIQGRVLDPSGKGLGGVFVFADTKAGKTTPSQGKGLHSGSLTNSDGSYRINVISGGWGVGSGAPASLGYMNPPVQRVTATSGQTVNVDLKYRASDGYITGSIYLSGSKHEGFVTAWSDKGGYSESMSMSGDYRLNVSKNDVWHVSASYDLNTAFYTSAETTVDLTTTDNASANLTMTQSTIAMPAAVSQTFSATTPTTIVLSNGMTITIPASSIATSGNITVTVTPNSQLAKQLNNRPLAFGYEIKAFNSSGQEITTSFSSDVSITIPYTDAMLADLGVTENDLGAAYFDTSSTLWQGITSVAVDKTNKTVTLTVNHFTPFALITQSRGTVAAATTTPTPTPTPTPTATPTPTPTPTILILPKTGVGVEEALQFYFGRLLPLVSLLGFSILRKKPL